MSDESLKEQDLNDKQTSQALTELDFNKKETLEALIEQTYVVENEYKSLKEKFTSLEKSHKTLRQMINEIIEVLPNALWVLARDKSIILQNELASQNEDLLAQIELKKSHYECEFNGRFFVVKNIKHRDISIIQATDISAEKRNERLVSMGSVAAHLAHEIRNPIGSISLLASTLYTRSELKNKHIVLEMQKAISRVERIVNSTLLFTKGVHINKACFDLSELKDECEAVVGSYNFNADIKFSFSFISREINADKSLLSLVLQNLIYNSIDAIEENDASKGEISITASEESGKIWVKVFDDGKEIADEKAVFEAFKTTKLKGNGLGLSLSKEIINAHGGELNFSTKPKCFYFTLPLQNA